MEGKNLLSESVPSFESWPNWKKDLNIVVKKKMCAYTNVSTISDQQLYRVFAIGTQHKVLFIQTKLASSVQNLFVLYCIEILCELLHYLRRDYRNLLIVIKNLWWKMWKKVIILVKLGKIPESVCLYLRLRSACSLAMYMFDSQMEIFFKQWVVLFGSGVL